MQPVAPAEGAQSHQQQQGGLSPATAALVDAATPSDALECRRFEVAGVGIEIRQDLKGSNALRPLDDDRVWADRGEEGAEAAPLILTAEDLSRVGLVVWQAGFVLADLLLRRPPFGSWHGAQVLDLGCGTGLVGILLALAGAEVTLTDQPHITRLAETNANANLVPGLHRWRVVPYVWGQGDPAAALLPPSAARLEQQQETEAGSGGQQAEAAARRGPEQPPPQPQQQAGLPSPAAQPSATAGPGSGPAPCFDVITAADVVYQPELYPALAGVLRALAAPHTLAFLSFKRRGLKEDAFLELLEGQGFALAEVPPAQLAEEYREGRYRVVRACRIE